MQYAATHVFRTVCSYQGCVVGAGVVRSRGFLGGVGCLTTLGAEVRFFCSAPTLDVQLDHFLHHTLKLGIPVEMVQFFGITPMFYIT